MANEVIIAVIVTFNPPGDIKSRIRAIAAETSHIVVVDNASDPRTHVILNDMQDELAGRLECLWNETNAGLAAALNRGISRALEMQAAWILLLDHDSEPLPGMIAAMLTTYAAQPDREQIALIAPNIRDENVSGPTRYLRPWGKFGFRRSVAEQAVMKDVLTVITSGSLIKAAVFRQAGLMPEVFFIDYIDHFFCLRLKTSGLKIMLVRGAVLRHRLGDKTAHKIGPLTITATHHTSMRRYYIFRNRLWVWRLYGRQFPGFVMHDILASGLDIFRILVYENQKMLKLKAIFRGIAAGLGKIKL